LTSEAFSINVFLGFCEHSVGEGAMKNREWIRKRRRIVAGIAAEKNEQYK
jgi:hypothetical protein